MRSFVAAWPRHDRPLRFAPIRKGNIVTGAGVRRGRSKRAIAIARLLAFAGVLSLAALAAWKIGLFDFRDPHRLSEAIRHVRGVRFVAVLFVGVYTVVTAFGLPATPVTLAGGAIFGVVLGSILNWMGATLGAVGGYWLARVIGGDAVHSLLGKHGAKLEQLNPRSGFMTIARFRLIPIVPFNVLDFACGLAAVPFWSYLLATTFGIIPGTVIYTYFADSLLSGASGAGRRALMHALIAGAVLIALSFSPAIVARARGKKRDASSIR